MATTRGVQCSDEEHVEYKQSYERTDCTKHEVAAHLVDDIVQLVVTQRRLDYLGVTLHKQLGLVSYSTV